MNGINWGGSQFDKLKGGLMKSPLTHGVAAGLVGGAAFGATAQLMTEQFSKSSQFSGLGLMSPMLFGGLVSNPPSPVAPDTTKDLEAIGQATQISGINGNVLNSLVGTGIQVCSPLLGAGLGAVLHLQSSPSGVEATLRDSDGSVTQLQAKSTSLGVEVKLDQDRDLNLYSDSRSETMYVSNDRGALSIRQQDGIAQHVRVEKYKDARGEGGVLAWNAEDSSLMTPGQSVNDLWRLSDELTQKKK